MGKSKNNKARTPSKKQQRLQQQINARHQNATWQQPEDQGLSALFQSLPFAKTPHSAQVPHAAKAHTRSSRVQMQKMIQT